MASVYIHDRKAYIAKVEVVDENDGDSFLSFMLPPVTNKVTFYRWPQQPDQVWVEKDCILCIVPEPMKLSRGFKVLPDTVETVQRLLEDWKNKIKELLLQLEQYVTYVMILHDSLQHSYIT